MEAAKYNDDCKPKIEDIEKDLKVPEEFKKKLEKLKVELEEFKKKVVKEFKEVIGIALFPPDKDNKDKVNVFVLFNDEDKKVYATIKNIEKIAKDIDKNIELQLMSLSDLKESLLDGKYEILQYIAMSAFVYDKGLLSALKVAEIHKVMALKKFEKYIISYVGAGSLFRGDSKPNDIDVFIVVDDTDVKRMSRIELKDKLGAIVRGMGAEASRIAGVEASFHVQTYILTDFWDAVKDAHPVIFTFLRDGIPLYDRGVFMPWKLLLKMGRIKPSPEAIEMQMDIGQKLLERIKYKMLGVVGEDLYYAILNPAQAAIMLYGMAPPTPKETIKILDEIFVKREKLLEKKYVTILEKIYKYYKDIEHGKIKDVQGKDVDSLLEDAKDYLDRLSKLFKQIEDKKDKENVKETCDNCLAVVKDSLVVNNIKPGKDIVAQFRKEFILNNKIPKKLYEILKEVIEMKNKKLSSQEIEKIRRESRMFIKTMVEYIQRKRGFELERAKIRFKYGDKFGEALLLGNIAFITENIDAKEKVISRAKINKDGGLVDIKKSSFEELEQELSKISVPDKVYIKEKVFEDLRKLFGKDIEILVNY